MPQLQASQRPQRAASQPPTHLQLITAHWRQHQHKHVHQVLHRRLALAHPHSLHQHLRGAPPAAANQPEHAKRDHCEQSCCMGAMARSLVRRE